jgi:acyl transferase domain-containing protein/acyl-CoA thioesterase FadM
METAMSSQELADSPNAGSPIAIIGMGCWLPGAAEPRQLWENVLARRREFRRVPDVRTPLSDYYDETGEDPDKFYQSKVAVIDGFEFDWASYRIPESSYIRTDACQWLVLEVAHRALKDAGYSRASAPKDRTGVFIGNTCTGEGMRSNSLRLRWPVVQRAMSKAAELQGISTGDLASYMKATEDCYKSIFPELNEDFLAGSISATIAGRICNYFDFRGGGFVIDGACASSLSTVVTAANMLASRDLDLALAGGVDISLDPFELVGFSRNGALSKSEIRPYDRRGDGFVAGEGAGLVVMKRLADAQRDGDAIYAVLRGWGLASDGKAGIMQPVARQQAAAVTRAAARAGVKLAELDFVEGHGTGTRAGDRTELEGLSLAMAMDAGDTGQALERSCGVGSLKSLIGHTKATAGVASLIKAVAAVNRRVVPPTASCEELNDAFHGAAARLFPVGLGEVRPSDSIVRAGVSAFGFGGINTHLIIESGGPPSPRLDTQANERALLASNQESELFVFGGGSKEDVLSRVAAVAVEAPLLSQSDLVDLAASLADDLPPAMSFRAAVIAETADDLVAKLEELRRALENALPTTGKHWVQPYKGVFIGYGNGVGRIGFLFPGQGSHQLLMARTLIERFDWARQLAEEAQRAVEGRSLLDAIYRPIDRARDPSEIDEWTAALSETEIAQPAICLASVLCARYLISLGINPSVVGGHSLGEITALHVAGAFDARTLFSIAALRGQVMRAGTERAGAMVSLACPRTEADIILSQISGTAVVANINSPKQTVVSGDVDAIDAVIAAATDLKITCIRLPVSNAFHSPLVARGAESFEAALNVASSASPLSVPVFSGVEFTSIDARTDLREHLARQITSPVNFIALARQMKNLCDVFIEVGPGRALSGLCRDIFDDSDICAPLASNALKWNPNRAVATAFVNGVGVDWTEFYAQRLVRPYVKQAQRIYLTNPAERPVALKSVSSPQNHPSALTARSTIQTALESALGQELDLNEKQVADYLRRRGKFLAGVARLDMASSANGAAPIFIDLPKPTAAKTNGVAAPTNGVTAPTWPVAMGGGKPSIKTLVELLVELISKRTGYPAASITSESRLLDDLNLDSIKAGELVAETARRIGAAGTIDATRFANASLHDIAAALHEVAPEAAPTAAAPQSSAQSWDAGATESMSLEAVIELLFELTSQRTGYPRSSIAGESRLLDDLNLDSIKAGELVAEATRRIGAAGAIDATRFANASLRDIATALHAVAPQAAPTAPAPQAPAQSRNAVAAESMSLEAVIELLFELTSQRTGYPRSSIAADSRLLDDLNLDSIKAGELVAEASRRIGVAGAIDATRFANASLKDIAAALVALLPESQPKAVVSTPSPSAGLSPQSASPIGNGLSFVSRYASWTRNYIVRALPTPRAGSGREADMTDAVFLVLFDPRDREPADALCAEIVARGGRAEPTPFDATTLAALQRDSRFTHRVAVLPRLPGDGAPTARLAEMISRVISIAQAPVKTASGRRRTTVAYVQFGGGRFGEDAVGLEPELCNALAFARTLHLERNDLCVRVLDFATSAASKTVADLVLDEIGGEDGFAAIGFDAELIRRAPFAELSEPIAYRARSFEWSEQDVILVTGGAKGIVAECALGIARETGATMVLVGRGKPVGAADGSGDSEIDRTLQRFRAEGLRHLYFSCDIVDAEALAETVGKIEAEVGPITGVIHAASVIRPSRTDNLTVDGLVQEVSPKVLGAWNLCRLLSGQNLKLFVVFSSLVVDHGMPWSAGYSFANETMERVVQAAASVGSPMPLQIISFGLWGEVGASANLKTNNHLLTVGLHDGEIPPEEGVRRFVEALTLDPGAQRLCIYGRSVGYGPWDQLRPAPAIPRNLRFIERVLHVEPEVELIARCRLTLQRDKYLHDHVYNGMYIVPTVLALEAIAEAGSALAGGDMPLCRLDGVEMPYPIVVDKEHGLEIELRAEIQQTSAADGLRRINVWVSTEQTGFKTVALSGTLVFGPRQELAQEPIALGEPLLVDARVDLYGRQFFVGPTYQRMGAIYSVNPEKSICVGDILADKDAARDAFNAIDESSEDRLVLGDPFFRDTLLHSSLLHHLEHMAFTARIDKIELFEGCESAQAARRLCVARLLWSGGKDAEYELVALSPTGRILERWTGFCSKALARQEDWPDLRDLLDEGRTTERDERELSVRVASAAAQVGVATPVVALECIPGFVNLPKEKRHAHERALAARAVDSATPGPYDMPDLDWLSTGRPHFEGDAGLDVSFSHEGLYCLCTVGPDAQGCDLATITHRTEAEWRALLGSARQPLIAALSADEPLDKAGTRIWAAVEAARKANQTDDEVLTIVQRVETSVLFRAKTPEKEVFILTLPLRFSHGRRSIVALTVKAPNRAEETGAVSNAATRILRDERLGCDVLEFDFSVTWKECTTPSRKAMNACYVEWFHRTREAMLPREDAHRWVAGVLDGTAGLVARSIRVKIHDEVTAHDNLCARIFLTQLSESAVSWRADFFKRLPDGGRKFVATVEAEGGMVGTSSNGSRSRAAANVVADYGRFVQTQFSGPDAAKGAGFGKLQRGEPIFELPVGPRGGPLLFVETMRPSLIDSDLVGNVSSIVYFGWLAHVRDHFLHSVVPKEMVRRLGASSVALGETLSVDEEMLYLREAFPFDDIKIEMRLIAATERGAKIRYEFLRLKEGGSEKIAVGHQHLLWVHRDAQDGLRAENFPDELLGLLKPVEPTAQCEVAYK